MQHGFPSCGFFKCVEQPLKYRIPSLQLIPGVAPNWYLVPCGCDSSFWVQGDGGDADPDTLALLRHDTRGLKLASLFGLSGIGKSECSNQAMHCFQDFLSSASNYQSFREAIWSMWTSGIFLRILWRLSNNESLLLIEGRPICQVFGRKVISNWRAGDVTLLHTNFPSKFIVRLSIKYWAVGKLSKHLFSCLIVMNWSLTWYTQSFSIFLIFLRTNRSSLFSRSSCKA